MNIFTGLPLVQVQVTTWPIIVQGQGLLRQKYFAAIIPVEEKAKYIHVTWQNFLISYGADAEQAKLSIRFFYRFFNGNLVFCLKLVEQCYMGSGRFFLINTILKP